MNNIKYNLIVLFSFYSLNADQASAGVGSLSPDSVVAGSINQSFVYTINFTGGTADSVSISNPFESQSITVTAVTIDGNLKSLVNQSVRPGNDGDVSWYYNADNHRLTVLCDTSTITSAIVLNFIQTVPQSVSTGNQYSSVFDDMADSDGPVTVTGSDLVVYVIAGSTSQIIIEDQVNGTGNEIEDLSLTTDQSATMFAVGRDQFNNFVENVSASWSVANSIGTLSSGSDNTNTSVFDPDNIGTGYVTINYNTFQDATGIINVTGGAQSYVKIRDQSGGGGSEVADVTMTTDESLALYAAVYDADDNYFILSILL